MQDLTNTVRSTEMPDLLDFGHIHGNICSAIQVLVTELRKYLALVNDGK